MQQPFRSKHEFEVPLPNSLWGKPQKCAHCNYSANQGVSLKKHILKQAGIKATPLSAMRAYLNIKTTSSYLRKHTMRKCQRKAT